MRSEKHRKLSDKKWKLVLNRTTCIGIISFLIVFYFASTLYPGGSQFSLTSVGFDWIHNYWCNLMMDTAMNGETNPAKPLAIAGLIFLCISIALFFIQFAKYLESHKLWKKAILYSGVLSMVLFSFLFTAYHDAIIILASLLALVSSIGVLRCIFLSDLKIYKYTGVVCFLMLLINHYIYHTSHGLEFLPILQKLSFIAVLIWILGINGIIRARIMDS